MPLPKFDALAHPVLTALAASPGGLSKRALYDRVAVELRLTPDQLAETISSGQSTFENRVGWACSWMKSCGWVDRPRRAHWVITEAGRARWQQGAPVSAAEMRPLADGKGRAAPTVVEEAPVEARTDTTPDERIHAALAEIVADVQSEVLSRLLAGSPLFFERTVLRLLDAMGYAGELGQSEHTGKTADGGVDGILYLDRLHLERVYVQAKRWQAPVGAAAVRDFAGAMDAESATKGVIFTTSGFTKEARAYVQKSPKAIRLVDGLELARLLVEFGVGVSRTTTVVLPRIDEDYFEDA